MINDSTPVSNLAKKAWLLAGLGVVIGTAGAYFYDDLFNCINSAYINGWAWLAYVDQPLAGMIWIPLALFGISWILSLITLFTQGSKLRIGWLFGLLTLFFLLVLLAINSLGTARTKAPGSSTKATIASFRATVQLTVSEGDSSYGSANNSCTAEGSVFTRKYVKELVSAVEGMNYLPARCYSTSEAWAVSIAVTPQKKLGFFCLKPEASGWDESNFGNYCADSTGFAGPITGPITGPVCQTVGES